MKFTEAQLEAAIIELLGEQGFPYVPGSAICGADGSTRSHTEVLIKDDLRQFLSAKYEADNITAGEIDSIILKKSVKSVARMLIALRFKGFFRLFDPIAVSPIR